MKGFILAAGLGTRLKPWTDSHPKALAPVAGIPALQITVEKMLASGISDITVNVFHFPDQIIEFINEKGWNIKISDERPVLLETGGAILKAAPMLEGNDPILVHNADIISNVDFALLKQKFDSILPDLLLLVSDRNSSRKLIFNEDMKLVGWHNLKTNEYKPAGFQPKETDIELAFSGIYILSPSVIRNMISENRSGKFSIIDYLMETLPDADYRGFLYENLKLIDIGKPDSLNQAQSISF